MTDKRRPPGDSRLYLRIDPGLKDRLVAYAAEHPGTAAEHVRCAIKEYLERGEEMDKHQAKLAERFAEYAREQTKGHMERKERMKAEGKPWYPTNKRQFPRK